MNFLLLSNDEKNLLKQLNQNKALVLALKKLFINIAFERSPSNEVQFLAAQKIAINMLYDVFHDLDTIQIDNKKIEEKENFF